MRSFIKKLKKPASVLIAFVLILGFTFAPASPVLAPKPAEATGWPVIDIANFIKNTFTSISANISALSDKYLALKESTLDGIAYTLINAVIGEMIRDTTAWVASGFNGKPAFVENLGGYLGDVADQTIGDYIWDSDALGFVCSPFQLDIKIALDMQYNTSGGIRDYRTAQCSLTGIGDNIQGAIDNLGDYMTGSWQNWFEVTLNDNNNPIGAYFNAEAGLATALRVQGSNETKMLSFGSGFFSKKDENGNVITPGQTIQTSIANTLNVPNERLAFSDEINELIGALLTQLARGVLSEASGGLRGLGSSGGSSEGGGSAATTHIGDSFQKEFDEDKDRENQMSALAVQGTSRIDSALGHTGGSCDAQIRSKLTAARTSLGTERSVAQQNLTRIAQYEIQLNANGLSVEDAQYIINTYLNDVRPTLHTNMELAAFEANLAEPTMAEDEVLEAMADEGNVVALAQLYEHSCDSP